VLLTGLVSADVHLGTLLDIDFGVRLLVDQSLRSFLGSQVFSVRHVLEVVLRDLILKRSISVGHNLANLLLRLEK